MDNIRVAIELFFGRINHYNIKDPFHNIFQDKKTKKWFCSEMAYLYPFWYNHENILDIYNLLQNEWIKGTNNYSGVFNMLYNYTSDMLEYDNGKFRCKDSQFLRWRKAVDILGEDILSTNYLSNRKKDIRDFNWDPHIKSNSPLLHSHPKDPEYIDLHFHLHASSLNFMLNWTTLMNYTSELEYRCKDLYMQEKTYYNVMPEFDLDLQKKVYYNELITASIIRVFLYKLIDKEHDYNTLIKEELFNCLDKDMKQIIGSADQKLELLREELEEQKISKEEFVFNRIDYALDDGIDNEKLNICLSGERKILYHTFLYIHKKNKYCTKVEKLLFLYVILKTKLREKLVQKKKHIGLYNFKKYNNISKILISEKNTYQELPYFKHLLAIKNTIETQNLKYLEIRISPCENYEKEIRSIDKLILSNNINDLNLEEGPSDKALNELKYHYIIHFHKPSTPQSIKEDEYRFQNERKEYFLTAEKLLNFLNSYSRLSQRIVGVDAAGTEMYCRPEIFAVAYRYLKEKYKIEETDTDKQIQHKRSRLGFTYHVGEDFSDITNGLRSIDEAVHFLELQPGDRISHALALGENVDIFYQNKNNTVILSAQDRLDDLVWLYMKNKTEYNSKKIEWLKSEAEGLFMKIYSNKNWNIELYYNSMLLRGDDPEYYMITNNNAEVSHYRLAHKNINGRKPDELRQNIEIRNLYHAYHFSLESKTRGCKLDEYRISVEEKELIKKVQIKMQKLINKKIIYIECNPTSNILIGNITRYSSHPILKFSNGGLKRFNAKKIISSINTDDQGIFDTCIQNEYALMVSALSKERDSKGIRLYSDRKIASWVSKIKNNADLQKFRK